MGLLHIICWPATIPGVTLPSRLGPPTSATNQENILQACLQPDLRGLMEVSPLDDYSYVKLA